MPTIVNITAKANSEVSLENVDISTLFRIFYCACIRQETDSTNDLMMLHLKRFGMHIKHPTFVILEATKDEFERLLDVCRQISKSHPEFLSIDDNISYEDPLDKRIGMHNFIGLSPNEDKQISEFIAKYFPNEQKI